MSMKDALIAMFHQIGWKCLALGYGIMLLIGLWLDLNLWQLMLQLWIGGILLSVLLKLLVRRL